MQTRCIRLPVYEGKDASDPALLRRFGAFELLLHDYSVEHSRHFCIVAEVESKKSPIEYRNAFGSGQLVPKHR